MTWDMGGGFGGGRGAAHGSGLPFAGIPWEMQDGVDRLVAAEPPLAEPDVVFSHRRTPGERLRLTLRGLLFAQWRLGAAAVAVVVLISVANQAGPKLVEIGIDDGMLRRGGMPTLVGVSVAFLASILVSGWAQRAQARVTGRLAAGVMHSLRIQVFTHLQRLGLDFYTEEKAGVVMTRMTADIENLQQLLQDGLAQIAVQALTMVVITVILFAMNVELALITVALSVPPLLVMSLWFRSRSERGYLRVRDAIAAVLTDLSESLHGVRVITAHNRQRHNIINHRAVVGSYRDANMYTAEISAVYGPGTQLLGYLGQAALLGIGGDMVLHHTLSIGELVAFFLYLNRFFSPIQLLVQQYNSYQRSQAAVTKLRSLLATEPTVRERPDAAVLPPITGSIELRDVTFGYDPAVPVLSHVSLRIAPGETVAFVGPTGAGKSTLAKLVTRFYDPTDGAVLIDGHDLRTVTLTSLRSQLGVVPQEPFLFAGTLRDNIAFARPEASDEEVAEAVRTVGLEALVARLPAGVDTVVHERGQSLSSGERQLIALARAFLAHPRVLVLDEATSNLDLASETYVERALEALLDNRTAILIAHRLTTAMKADRIIVVDGGRVVETGSHDELVANAGRYAQMFQAWTRHAEPRVA